MAQEFNRDKYFENMFKKFRELNNHTDDVDGDIHDFLIDETETYDEYYCKCIIGNIDNIYEAQKYCKDNDEGDIFDDEMTKLENYRYIVCVLNKIYFNSKM